jgi:hypothetical protein
VLLSTVVFFLAVLFSPKRRRRVLATG